VHANVQPCGGLTEHVCAFQTGKGGRHVSPLLRTESGRNFGIDVRADAGCEWRHQVLPIEVPALTSSLRGVVSDANFQASNRGKVKRNLRNQEAPCINLDLPIRSSFKVAAFHF
jgi:hypothetical protein